MYERRRYNELREKMSKIIILQLSDPTNELFKRQKENLQKKLNAIEDVI